MTDTEHFTCAHCGETYIQGWSDEEALAQTRADYGINVRADDRAVICDDCYTAMTAWWNALPDTERQRLEREGGYTS